MHYLKQFFSSVNRYRRIWMPLLLALVLLRICAEPVSDKPETKEKAAQAISAQPGEIKSYEQLEEEYVQTLSNQETPSPWMPYLWMTGLVALIFLIQRRNLMPYLLPAKVWIMASVKRVEGGNDHLLRIRLLNHTRTNQAASEPLIVFSNLIHKRAFKLQLGDFPLVLTPKTAHGFTLSLQKFAELHPDLKTLPFVHIEFQTGTTRRSRSLPSWIRWKK